MKLPPNFELKKSTAVKELNATFHHIEHKASGAQIIHLECDDEENLFCLSFQTLPKSSNGVAHILEHTVLCGSKKFPVKDPFFAMDGRSLNTYMNALTGSDFTCYPAASQVEKDFYNLLEVYLDAVFHPDLKELSFAQEGHRLEFQEEKDPSSPLVYKGIVFNEMKGSLASAETRLWHMMNHYLLPDLPYAYNSGGDPAVIPELTFEELVDFHKTYYHPSRCLFFFYGNFSIVKHLQFIETNALHGVGKLAPLPPLKKQRRFTEPLYREERYPTSQPDLKQKTFITFGWLTCDVTDQSELLAISLLESILMDTDASPLKLALVQSGLCIEADGFMDAEMSEIPYLIICRGSEPEHADALEKILFDTLKKIADDGIDEKLITSSLHQLEFNRLEIQGDGGPFGLTLFFRSALAMQHGADPITGLLTYSHCEALLERVKDPQFFPRLIRTYFLDNAHYVRLIFKPDPQKEQEELATEKAQLQKIAETLNREEKEAIIDRAEKLKEFQELQEEQKLDCLPKITLDDIPDSIKEFPLERVKQEHLTYFHHECFTNHIVYADLVFDLPDLSLSELPYFSLMTHLFPDLGCGHRNYLDNLFYIQNYLGGYSAGGALNPQYEDPEQGKPSFSLRGKTLSRHTDKLFKLFYEAMTCPRFDERQRIKELILQHYNALQSRINRNPLQYATMLSVAGFSKQATIKNHAYGFEYYRFIESLAKDIDGQLDRVVETFHRLQEKIFHKSHPQLVLCCDRNSFDLIHKERAFGLADLPATTYTPWRGDIPLDDISSHGRVVSSPVAFTAFGLHTVSASDPRSPLLSLSTEIMDNKVLHKRIREQGGAYGGGANYNPMSGNFTCYGYRDPHIQSTLEAFQEAFRTIASGYFDKGDIEEAKMQLLQSLDTPTSPGSRAAAEYFALREGKTVERRLKWRRDLIQATKKEIQAAVEKVLLPRLDQGRFVTFSNRALFEKEKTEFPILDLSQ